MLHFLKLVWRRMTCNHEFDVYGFDTDTIRSVCRHCKHRIEDRYIA